MATPQANDLTVTGKVFESLPNTLFRVKLDDPSKVAPTENGEILCYLAGKMRINKIRVLIGDTVTVQLDSYGGRGRIIKRG